MDHTDVIMAVASPPGRSARGIVRLSGPGSHELGAALGIVAGSGVRPARIDFGSHELPALALSASAPRSYTGEDTLELQVPGNPILLARVVDTMLDVARAPGIDARRAEGGDFTARAFMNGRISLTEAEGVAATIAARSDAELRAARLLTSGMLGRLADDLADRLAGVLALVEAGIDFTDQEDVVPISPADLARVIDELGHAIDDQLDRAVGTESLEAIPWVVLSGPPNVGKSTLFNTLVGHERVVVSDVAGTTRDVVAEPIDLGDAGEVLLVDVAGDDASEASLNRAMQGRRDDALGRAEVRLVCRPLGSPPPPLEPGDVLVWTKSDLAEGGATGVSTCGVSGLGLDDLRAILRDRLADRAVSLAADALALRPRHEAEFRGARAALRRAAELVDRDRSERSLRDIELVAASLRTALDHLGSLAGSITPDDVLGRVFSSFCVGK